MLRPILTPEITLGHLLQAAVLVVTVGAGAVTGYVTLRADMLASTDRAAKDVAGLASRVVVIEARREFDERFQADMRRSMEKLIEAVTELRVAMSNKQDRDRRAGAPMP